MYDAWPLIHQESDLYSLQNQILTIRKNYGYKIVKTEEVKILEADILIPPVNKIIKIRNETFNHRFMNLFNEKVNLVKELRAMTKASMADCNNVISAIINSGKITEKPAIIQKALQELQALNKIVKLSDGKIGYVSSEINMEGSKGIILAVTCAQDFTCKTDTFIKFYDTVLLLGLEHQPHSLLELLDMKYDKEQTISEAVTELSKICGEEIQISYYQGFNLPNYLKADYGYHHYTHMNKIAVIGLFKTPTINQIDGVRKILLQITGSNPLAAYKIDMVPEIMENEKRLVLESIKDKPTNIQEKILKGSLDKFLAQNILEYQLLHSDNPTDKNLTVGKYMEDLGIVLLKYDRFQID